MFMSHVVCIRTALPILNLYIFNATFDATAECQSGEPNYKRYNDFCAAVVRNLLMAGALLTVPVVVGQGVHGPRPHLAQPQQEASSRRSLHRRRYLQVGFGLKLCNMVIPVFSAG